MTAHPDAGLLAAEREMAEIDRAQRDLELLGTEPGELPERWFELRCYVAETPAFSLAGCLIKARRLLHQLYVSTPHADPDNELQLAMSINNDLARLAAEEVIRGAVEIENAPAPFKKAA